MTKQQLIHGDCLEEMDKLIEKGVQVDAIITDPPYGMDYQSARRTDKNEWKPKIKNDKIPYIWYLRQAFLLLKDGGCLISFCRFDSWSDFERVCKMVGFTIKAEIVWDKMNHGTGDLKGCPGFRHEIAIFATKGRFLLPSKRPQSLIQSPRINPKDLLHPNEKPVHLMEHLVEHYCPENGIVLDPFTGVSPVGLACKNLKRNFIGIELDDKYFQIAKDRISNG